MNGWMKLVISILASAILGAYAWATLWPIKILDKYETAMSRRIDRLEDGINERFRELYRYLQER